MSNAGSPAKKVTEKTGVNQENLKEHGKDKYETSPTLQSWIDEPPWKEIPMMRCNIYARRKTSRAGSYQNSCPKNY